MTNGESTTSKIAFGLFLVMLFSLGVIKPALDLSYVGVAAADLIFLLVVLAVGVSPKSISVFWHPSLCGILLYFAALCASEAFASSFTPSAFAAWMGKLFLVLLAILTAFIVTSRDRLRYAILAFLAGSIIPLTIGLIGFGLFYLDPSNQYLTEITYHYGAAPYGSFPRLNSSLVSPSMFCNYLTVVLIGVLVALKARWIPARVSLLLVSLIAVCATFTVSIALGGLLLGAGLWIAYDQDCQTALRRASIFLGTAAAVIFLLTALFSLSGVTSGELNPSSRVLVWRDAISTVSAHPFFGKGLGTGVADVVYQNSDGTYSYLIDAHNTFLSVTAQSGIIGLLSLLAMTAVFLRTGLRAAMSGSQIKLVGRGLLIAFVAAFLYDGLTSSFEDSRHLWVLMGLMIAADRISTDRSEPTEQPR